MSDKYIIRNCPAILKMTKICDDYRTTRDNPQLCKDCTDCVMKQIVERCREAQKEYPRHFPDGELDMFVSGRNNLAGIMLALLDIEESSDGEIDK